MFLVLAVEQPQQTISLAPYYFNTFYLSTLLSKYLSPRHPIILVPFTLAPSTLAPYFLNTSNLSTLLSQHLLSQQLLASYSLSNILPKYPIGLPPCYLSTLQPQHPVTLSILYTIPFSIPPLFSKTQHPLTLAPYNPSTLFSSFSTQATSRK